LFVTPLSLSRLLGQPAPANPPVNRIHPQQTD